MHSTGDINKENKTFKYPWQTLLIFISVKYPHSTDAHICLLPMQAGNKNIVSIQNFRHQFKDSYSMVVQLYSIVLLQLIILMVKRVIRSKSYVFRVEIK